MKESWRTNIFFTSDLHLNHENSIKFDERPFKDLEDMHESLIRRYNSTVGPKDIVYFLGDLGIGSPQDLGKIIRRLNGTKIMILGNHDKGGIGRHIQMGFTAVLNSISFTIGGQLVTASHCPLLDTYRENTAGMRGSTKKEPWHGNSRKKHRLCSLPNFGQFHLSGHIHSRSGVNKSNKILGRQYDVGVPANNYTPVSLATIESWIAKTLRMEEDYRDIPGYSDYRVNSFGQVKSFKRYPEGKILSTQEDKDGYFYTTLHLDNGKPKKEKIHRLVANAFIENKNKLPQVNHKNGQKFDNLYTNLEWASNVENQRHAWNSGLKVSTLTTKDVSIIKALLSEGLSNKDIGINFTCDLSTISNIKTGKCWKDIDSATEEELIKWKESLQK